MNDNPGHPYKYLRITPLPTAVARGRKLKTHGVNLNPISPNRWFSHALPEPPNASNQSGLGMLACHGFT